MEIKDKGFVLLLHRIEETSGIVKVFSKYHGVCSGFVKNVNSKQNQNIYFPGNLISFTWKARLATHTGNLYAELITSYSSVIMLNYVNILALGSMCAIIEVLFKEHEPISGLFDYIKNYVEDIVNRGFDFKKYINLELFLLAKAGYSLDLSECAVTGTSQDLSYLSPKSGKAVSLKAGEAYKNRLLKLPKFMVEPSFADKLSIEDIIQSLRITSYFFERYIFPHVHNQGRIKPRDQLINYLIEAK